MRDLQRIYEREAEFIEGLALGWREEVDPSKLDEETRRRLLQLVLAKGITYRELGLDRTYFYRIRTGKYRITDNVLRRLLEFVTEEEFRRVVGTKTLEAYGIAKNGVVDYGLVIDILNRAKQDPYLKSLLMRWAAENLLPEMPHVVRITEEHLKRFERLLSTRSKKTREDRLRYLRRALEELEWELTPEKLEDYILSLYEDSPHVAQHIAKTLKLFIKTVLRDPKLYHAFKVPRAQGRLVAEPLSFEEVAMVAKTIKHIGAKTYFVLLAETGLRPGELLPISLDQVDLERRTIKIEKISETKRSYITFLHRETAAFLRERYLPFRQHFLERYAPAMRNLGLLDTARNKLFPFKDYELRQEIYRAMDRALGRRFRLYDLRAFFAAYLTKRGVSPLIINILQGRVPPREFRVLQQHYLPFSLEDLRRVYEENAPCITCVLRE